MTFRNNPVTPFVLGALQGGTGPRHDMGGGVTVLHHNADANREPDVFPTTTRHLNTCNLFAQALGE